MKDFQFLSKFPYFMIQVRLFQMLNSLHIEHYDYIFPFGRTIKVSLGLTEDLQILTVNLDGIQTNQENAIYVLKSYPKRNLKVHP